MSSPAIVSHLSVRPLPRWVLWVICLAYLLPGYIGREPWKSVDVGSYASIMAAAAGGTSWWWPHVAGEPVADFAPLLHGIGMVIARWLGPEVWWSYQIPGLLALGLVMLTTWHAAFRFALLPGSQPMTWVFGGEPKPLDYARAIADSALLALLACLGLAQISHEVGPAMWWVLGAALLLWSAALALNRPDAHRSPTWLIGYGMGLLILVLSGQPLMALLGGLAFPVWLVGHWVVWPRAHQAFALTLLLWVVATVMALVIDWPVESTWIRWEGLDAFGFLQLLAWFTWPAGLLAVWSIWKWKGLNRSAHVALPALFAAVGMLTSLLQGESDRALLTALPPLAILAAFALPTLRRSASALVDWFSLLFFSFCALAIWVIWVAMLTGVPAGPARNVARLAPGFAAQFEPLGFFVAACATMGWIGVVVWRSSHHPQGLWKSLIIPASGSTLSWLLLMTLWLPLLNHARGYGTLLGKLTPLVPSDACVIGWQLQNAQVAALVEQGRLTVVRSNPQDARCEYLISAINPSARMIDTPPPDWTRIAQASRLTEQKETLVLWRRPTANQPR